MSECMVSEHMLTDIEKDAIRDRMSGMARKDQEYALRFFDLDVLQYEVERRCTSNIRLVNKLIDILDLCKDDMSTSEVEKVLIICKKLLKEKEE